LREQITTLLYLQIPVNLATKAVGVLYLLAVPFTPCVGAIVSSVGNELIFLQFAYILAGLGHLVFLTFKGFFSALLGMTLLSAGYGLVGCCLWPCIGALVDKDYVGKAYGLAYATQQLGLTVAAAAAGYINDKLGYYWLETFFMLVCGVGLACSLFLLKTLGRNMPKKAPVEEVKEDNEDEKKKLKE